LELPPSCLDLLIMVDVKEVRSQFLAAVSGAENGI